MHETETTDSPIMKYGGLVYPHRGVHFFRNERIVLRDKLSETSHSPAIGHYRNPTVSQVGEFLCFLTQSILLNSGINPSDMLASQLA